MEPNIATVRNHQKLQRKTVFAMFSRFIKRNRIESETIAEISRKLDTFCEMLSYYMKKKQD